MAIVVQEERQNTTGILYILGWIIFGIIILIGIYYVFFKNPELYEKTVSTISKNKIEDVVQIGSNIDLNSIMENSTFKSLKNYIEIPQNVTSGKSNPFAQ
jgi:hypothetical protein